MLSDKKGQHMMGLPFVFIISMVIAAVIVISAVYTIKNFSCRGEQVEINLFVNELRNEIEKSFYTTPDSQTVFDGTLPKGCAVIPTRRCYIVRDHLPENPSSQNQTSQSSCRASESRNMRIRRVLSSCAR